MKKINNLRLKDKSLFGFTLIELLMVVSIISLLIISGFFLVKGQYLKARDARRKSDMHKIQEAVEEYEKDHDCYPQPDLVACKPDNVGLIPYMAEVPCDPATEGNYYYENDSDTCARWYRIFISLGNLNDKDILPGIGPGSAYNFYLASPNAPVPLASESSPVPTFVCGGNNYFGCISGECVAVACNNEGTGPVCQPGFDNPNCNGAGNCGTPVNPLNECI